MRRILPSVQTISRWVSGTLALLLVLTPNLSAGQTTDFNPNTLYVLGNRFAANEQLLIPEQEQLLWQALEDSQLTEFDKRLMTLTLPALSQRFGLIAAQSLLGYSEEDQQVSREFDGATNTSLRATGKAAAITAIGQTNCADTVTFGQNIASRSPLWLHHQLDQDADPQTTQPLSNFFGRSFDQVATQSFWLEARAFTHTLVTPDSWSDFLQKIGKGALEEQFRLPAGSLAHVSVGDLTQTVGRLRIASQLGLPDIPEAANETQFYATLGQWQLEQELALPRYSLQGQTWREIYQDIGFRVLEEQLSPGSQDVATSPFGTTVLSENSRFTQLAKQLELRREQYEDPRRALNLPTADALPNPASNSSIYDRLINGDPTAFATVGAYFLADSLFLPAAETERLIQAVDRGEEQIVSLAQARPIAASYTAERFFSAESTPESRQTLFTQYGREFQTTIETNLERLNESVLLAFGGTNNTPTLSTVLALLTNTTRREAAYQQVGKQSAAEASYADGFAIQPLRQKGRRIFGQAINLTDSQLADLEDTTQAEAEPEIKAIGLAVDSAMSWPEGTALTIARPIESESSLTTIGATRLWQRLGLSETAGTALTELYLTSQIATDLSTGEETEETNDDETVEEDTADPDNTLEGDDEVILESVPADQLSLVELLKTDIHLPSELADPLLAGRFLPSMAYLTLTRLANDLNEASTITPGKLLDLYIQPTKERIESITTQAEAVRGVTTLSPDLFTQLTTVKDGSDLSSVWRELTYEVVTQWNITCPSKSAETGQAINDLVNYLIALPAVDDPAEAATTLARPVQIITEESSTLDDDVRSAVTAAYPGFGEENIKWGVYSAPRAWDHLFIGY